MSQNYIATEWIDNRTVGTASVMNNMEKGIENAHNRIDVVDSQIKQIGTSGSTSIDDTTTATNKTWSSSKINSQIREKANQSDLEVERERINSFNSQIREKANQSDLEVERERIDSVDSQIKNITTLVTPEMFGAVGDKIADDTMAIQNAINSLTNGGIVKFKSSSKYKVTNTLTIPSNITLDGNNASIFYYGEGKNIHFIDIQGNSAVDFLENITIKNITLDCSNQQYKGGLADSIKITSVTPISRGMIGIYIRFSYNVKIENIRMNDVYGDGIVGRFVSNVKIDRNTLINCSGGHILKDGDVFDYFGDGICFFSSYDIKCTYNTIVNTRTYLAEGEVVGEVSTKGKLCGRSGLEFEYALNQGTSVVGDITRNPPYFNLLNTTDEIGVLFEGNYVYGYTKGCHLEEFMKAKIINNEFVNNHIGLNATIPAGSLITNNYFNSNNVGKAPQSGYGIYYCGVALNNFLNDNFMDKKGVVVSGNVFDGDSDGVIVVRDSVLISSNIFVNKGVGVGNFSNGNELTPSNINISSNMFYKDGININIYNTYGWIIESNVFNSPATYNKIDIESRDIKIANNNFYNSRINFGGNEDRCNNISIVGNRFEVDDNFKDDSDPSMCEAILRYWRCNNLKVKDNIFNNKLNIYTIYIRNNAFNVDISENVFNCTHSAINKVSFVDDFKFEKNICNSALDSTVLLSQGWDSVNLILRYNKINNINSKIYKQTGGIIVGICDIQHNIGGIVDITNYKFSPQNETYYNKGDRIINYNLSNSSNVWCKICVQAGIYSDNTTGAIFKDISF